MTPAERFFRGCLVAMLALLGPLVALAQDDPPGRVGRVADLQGAVSIFDNEQGQWVPAQRNRPLTSGDRLSTDAGGRAELDVGSTTLRLGGESELEVLRIDDDRLAFQLHSGSLALHVRSREVADEAEIVTDEAKLHPLRSGLYRVDRLDDSTYAAVWRGELRVEDNDQPFTVDAGKRAEVWREGSRRVLRHAWTAMPDDEFSTWVAREDGRDQRSVANRYVSPEMTGADDLDRYGTWEQSPDYGAVWIPTVVVGGWAPYRYGHWAWVEPWGWTWVDDAPWGFAPFHYGRWANWRGRWCWVPGGYVARPVYAPALVAWVGGPNFSVSVSVGGPPSVGWVPLAPREPFVPYYRATPVYAGRINPHPPGRPTEPPPPRTGPIMYGNQGVPNAVTVVPRDVLLRRQPVARAVVDVGEIVRRPLPVQAAAPLPAPAPPAHRPLPGTPMHAPPPRGATPSLRPVPGGAEAADPRREGGLPRPTPAARPAAPVVDLRQQQQLQQQQQQQRERQAQEAQARERAAQERAAQQRAQQERAQQERVQQEHALQEKMAREKAAQEKAAQEKAAAERRAPDRQDKPAPERGAPQPAASRPRPSAEEPGRQQVPETRPNMREREQVR